VGSRIYPNGNKHVGEWKDGKQHGQGTYIFGPKSKWAGDKYVGEYRNGKRNGQGTYIYPSGAKYVGENRNGKQHGQGTYTASDGEKYVGEWRNGKFHGQGTATFASGAKHVGEWGDGKRNGQGTFTHADGRVKEGVWKDNKFQYVKKDPSPRRSQKRLAERRRRKKEERLSRLERELRRKEARLRQREKEFEKKKRQSWTARKTSPVVQDDWRSSGSSFYLKGSTHIMTNFHVIEKARVIQVSFPKGRRYRGRVVAKDERNDLAVVKLLKMRPRRSGFGFRFGARVRVGERTHALGYPLGASLSRYPSMVSGEINATKGMGDNLSQFRTNANINKGNSGGPIVNDKGELVGVALAGLVQRGVEGVRFGIKATAASLVLEQVPAMEKFDVQVRARKRKRSPSKIFRELSPYVVMIEVR